MASFDEVKRRILERVSLPDLVREKLTLQSRSGRHVGLCPFHEEKTPSFHVFDDHYHCFGCKAHGDAIDFLRKLEGLSFYEALKRLAAKFGIEAPELERSNQDFRKRKKEASLYNLMAEAQAFFAGNLASPQGREATEYLKSRGFSSDNIAEFGFGLTPRESYGLARYLRSKGYRQEDMEVCGVTTTSNRDGRPFDCFRERIMIPIRDKDGRVVGFGGRALREDGAKHIPKYINSRETKLFDKSTTLFGFDKARPEIRKKNRAVIVEGYMDALQLWQQGFRETVACLGTALTEWQLRQLRNATSEVILVFDGDSAGQKATLASVNVALKVPEVQVRAVQLPEGEDPDSFVRGQSVEAFEECLDQSVYIFDFAVRKKLAGCHELAVPDLISREFIPWLAQIREPIQRQFLLTRIGHLTGIPGEALEKELRSLMQEGARGERAGARAAPQEADAGRRNRAPHEGDEPPATPAEPPQGPARECFGHVFFSRPGELDLDGLREFMGSELDLDPTYERLMADMIEYLSREGSPSETEPQAWATALSDDIYSFINALKKEEAAFSCTDRPARVARLRGHIRERKRKASLSSAKARLSRLAAQPGREQEVNELLKYINELTKAEQTSAGPS